MSAFLKKYEKIYLAAGVYLSEASSPPRFLFGVVKQFCMFRIWPNTQCITPLYAFHTTRSPPPPVTHCMNTYPCTYSHRERGRGVGEPVRTLERRKFTRGVENTNMTDCISSL
jgi:hypothetical protein